MAQQRIEDRLHELQRDLVLMVQAIDGMKHTINYAIEQIGEAIEKVRK